MKTSILFFVVLILIINSIGFSQSLSTSTQSTTPLQKLLNPDGTVNLTTGFSGSIDPKGFTMTTGPNGEPRFKLASDPNDVYWADIFGNAEFNDYGYVYAIAVSGNDIYVGGSFTTVGGLTVNRIAKWDGHRWYALGSGVNGTVYAIAVNGSDVYVGGSFTSAGGWSANRIAQWNGSSWSSLGSGISGLGSIVYAIVIMGSDVYAGGRFTNVYGAPISPMAKWNGSTWSAIPSISGTVYAFAVSGTNLYVGGDINYWYIARWDGSSWHTLLTGLDGIVYSITVSGTNIFVGGAFTGYNYGGAWSAPYIAEWNGSLWSRVGTGINNAVHSLVVGEDGNVYAGGYFTTAGGNPAAGIAKWDGISWSALSSGMNATPVRALAKNGNSIYAGGPFTTAGGEGAKYLASWNGTYWSALKSGMNNMVFALAVKDSDLYVGGNFTKAGMINASHIAKWDGNNWSALGSGTNGQVAAIAIKGSQVYVGGGFSQAGGVSASNIARWDGSNWYPLGIGVDNYVLTIIPYQFGIYVGGGFITAGGITVNRIAVWNETQWWPMGTGMDYGEVCALAFDGTYLYAGGYFGAAGGVNALNIARWNDYTGWDSLSSGMNNAVKALAINGGNLYAGGQFSTAGGISASRVAKWDGSNWSQIGDGLIGYVNTLAFSNNELYVGGNIALMGGLYSRIAHLDGGTWTSLGSGLNSESYALAAMPGYLYVGGIFSMAGDKSSFNIGRWTIPSSFFASPSTISFGSLDVGSNKTDSVTITNPSDVILNINSVFSDNGAFSVVPTSGSIPSSGSMKFYVTFHPTIAGWQLGHLVFSHNGLNSADTVTVTGIGTVSITINKRKDTDGNLGTIIDQVPMLWELSLYYDSISTDSRVGHANTSMLTVPVSVPGRYIACEADMGPSWWRINGNHTLCDTFFVFSAPYYDEFVNFHPNTITVRKFQDNDGNFATKGDRVPKTWHLELRRESVTGPIIYFGDATDFTLNGLGDGTYYAIEADSTDYIHLGYEIYGVSNPSTTNNVAITVSDGAIVTCDFINAPPTYSQWYRTATAFDWATAYDVNLKVKSVKRKYFKTEFHFPLTIPSNALAVKAIFSNVVTYMDSCQWETWSFPCSGHWSPYSKEFILGVESYTPGSIIHLNGFCAGGKSVKVKLIWSTLNGLIKENVTVFYMNQPLLPKPNLHNVGEELFASGAFPSGLLIGIPEGSKDAHSVLLKKYKDVQSSLNKKGQLHTGDPDSLEKFSDGTPINKQQKKLPPDKQNNKLFAELVALKLNIAASMREKFPPGLGQLTFDDPNIASRLLNGLLVDSIVRKADSVISGLPVIINGNTLKPLEVYDVIQMIDNAFADMPNFKDTSSFALATKLIGVKPLIDVPYLHKTAGIEPVIISSPVILIEDVPTVYGLYQNYPNPFNPITTIQFDLPEQAIVTLKVYNVLGQEVATLIDNELLDEGNQEVELNAQDLSSGVYFYQIVAAGINSDGIQTSIFNSVKKMLLLR